MIQTTRDYFQDYGVLGQEKVRSHVNFLLNSYEKTNTLLPVLLTSGFGTGKSLFAHIIAKNLRDSHGLSKNFIEINGASLNSVPSFIRDIVEPYIIGNKEVTIFIDEIHCVNRRVLDWLLKVLTLGPQDNSVVMHNSKTYEFDFRKISFIAATTNQERLTKAFLSRFVNRIEMEEYKPNDLAGIILKNANFITFEDGVENEMALYSRNVARQAVTLAKHVRSYCDNLFKKTFNHEDWLNLRKTIGINYLGLNNNEVRVLKYLNEHGEARPTLIASQLSVDMQTLTKEIELFLFKKNLIESDGKRRLTEEGKKAIKYL